MSDRIPLTERGRQLSGARGSCCEEIIRHAIDSQDIGKNFALSGTGTPVESENTTAVTATWINRLNGLISLQLSF